jgi:hypothetical protein
MFFGSNLSETLKSVKNIIKSAADIRSSVMQSTASKPTKAVNRPLNYRGPPSRRRQFPPPWSARDSEVADEDDAQQRFQDIVTSAGKPRWSSFMFSMNSGVY